MHKFNNYWTSMFYPQQVNSTSLHALFKQNRWHYDIHYSLEQAFSESLHRHFPTVNTQLVMTIGAVVAAGLILTEEERADPGFKQLVSDSIKKEQAASDRSEELYRELIGELVKIVETPNMWVSLSLRFSWKPAFGTSCRAFGWIESIWYSRVSHIIISLV